MTETSEAPGRRGPGRLQRTLRFVGTTLDPRELERALKAYLPLLSEWRRIHYARALLGFADGYAYGSPRNEALQGRAARLYRHVADVTGAVALRAGAPIAPLPCGSPAERAHHAFAAMTAPRRRLGKAVLANLAALAACLVLCMLLAAAVSPRVAARLFPADLALHRPWRASSLAARHAGEEHLFFFHTQEEDSPWLEIDLGQVEEVSEVRVENRTDCCRERALPLLVELSTDQVAWTEVAQRRGLFSSWTATFPPRGARWVRLRTPRRTTLHLRAVSVF